MADLVALVRVGGGLNYVTAPMGGGKSLYGTRRIVGQLGRGGYVLTNVRLLEIGDETADGSIERVGWDRRILRRQWPTSLVWTRKRRQRVLAGLREHYVYVDTIEECMRYRVAGHGEGRALFVWDESHNDLNNRNWRERQAKHSTGRGTDGLLEWATQLRKLGYVGFLLSQHADNTDAALRRVCNFHVRLQNQRENIRFMGLRLRPLPSLFLADWFQANSPRRSVMTPVTTERYMLSWHRKLYNTFDLYHGLDDDQELVERDDVIWLGRGAARLTGAKRPAIETTEAGSTLVALNGHGPNAQRAPLLAPAAETEDAIPARHVLFTQ